MKRSLRVVATLVVTALATAYVVWRIDLGETVAVIRDADAAFLGLAIAIMLGTVPAMAWRWQLLLSARGIHDRVPWLTRAYLTSYTAGQVLPTAVGGDAWRIIEGTRRHPGRGGDVAGSVLLERALGGTATLMLAGAGFVLAVGRYDVGAYLWVEAAFVAATIALAFVLFSRTIARPIVRYAPRPLRIVYEGLHAYRAHGRVLATAIAMTLVVQAVRVLAIWAAARAAGVDLSPRVYYVMGPLLFLVMLVPFTINGLAVREAFFVSFLGTLGVPAEQAFAAGFLFFVVTVLLALPGATILAWEGLRGGR
ncbi:MAG TPA: lysylphosphatidylglycerol synthase transmembrane domain-containing protein [Gaiellaceae bacterium]|nr:lysylphosphatidylglycerol synthase transmembrane domain-containing protein [Gaiellaceae bacterium]